MAKNKNAENNQENLLKQEENNTTARQEVESAEVPNIFDKKELAVVDDIFERYANINRYYKASDGTSFFKKTDALNYAQKLADKNITEINR